MSAELKVVAWLTSWQKDRFRTAGSIVTKLEPPQKYDCNQYDPLVRLSDAEAEIAALKEDAERYRWLRDGKNPGNRYPHLTQYPYQPDLDKVQIPQMVVGGRLRPENIDAAIDSARAAGDGEGKAS